MRSLLLLTLVPLALFSASCSNVVSKQPVGEKPWDTGADLLGRWRDGDGSVPLIVSAGEDGKSMHLGLEGEEEKTECQLRQTGSWVFLNVALEGEPGEEGGEPEQVWLWLVAKLVDQNTLALWWPETNRFAELVRAKTIPGQVVETTNQTHPEEGVRRIPSTTVTIDDPAGAWVPHLVSGNFGVPIHWQEPIVLRRVPDEE